jgi:hypothetical protein
MPCCHKDHSGSLKAAAVATGVPLGVAMDFALVGRINAAGFRAKLVTIDASITPHNRLVLGLPPTAERTAAAGAVTAEVAVAEAKLQSAYLRAHRPRPPNSRRHDPQGTASGE